ncbi:MAG: DUF3320 domain-containing protein [Thermoanaerobaculia bacterium]|nr:DUF3320 domain-containing protein [Thermoanaerobaculia bacterium]
MTFDSPSTPEPDRESAISAREAAQRKYDKALTELLDLGLRNTLLNHRELKARGLRIVDELSDQIFRILVLDEKEMSFLPAPDEGEEQDFLLAQPEEDEDTIADRHTDTKLQTNYTSEQLQKRLRNTHDAARNHIEERGVNVLFLALGFLHWYESEKHDTPRTAPILLIPIELQRKSVKSRFHVRYSGTDLAPNRPLELKMKSEFGLELPPFPDPAELNIESLRDYFATIEKSIKEMPLWRLEVDEMALGFFSFAKLQMYEDLDPANWPEDSHPLGHELIDSILTTGFASDPNLSFEERPLDEMVTPSTSFQVVDADSSQTEAIEKILAGTNLVIQGPPGTGKSQTITNVIAECVAKGKKVLFVAEKMAALDVVYRRLEAVGLGDACLELHSHRSNKRELLQELDRVMRLGEPLDPDRESTVATLTISRDKLNDYAQAVNAPVMDTGLSPFRLYGELLRLKPKLDELEPPSIERSTLLGLSSSEAQQVKTELEELQALLGRMGVPAGHPFYGSAARSFIPPLDGPTVAAAASQAGSLLQEARASFSTLAGALGLERPDTVGQAETTIRCAARILESPDLRQAQVKADEWQSKATELDQGIRLGARIKETRVNNDALMPHAWERDVSDLRTPIKAYGGKWWRFLAPSYRAAKRELAGMVEGEVPKKGEEQLRAVDAILLVRRLQNELGGLQELLTSIFGGEVNNWRCDWSALREASQFLHNVHDELAEGKVRPEILDFLDQRTEFPHLESSLATATEKMKALDLALRQVLTAAKYAENSEPKTALPDRLGDLEERLSLWSAEPGRLQEIARLNHQLDRLQDKAMSDLADAVVNWSPSPVGLVDLFLFSRHSALLEHAFKERPTLALFEGAAHETILDRFKTADQLLLETNRVTICHQHWTRLPEATGEGQMGTLMHEMQKKRRHRPIRQLMAASGRAIQAIKPVFMMSPMSIATFLPPGSAEFDLVLFDEASQIQPVEAFGALLRGKQAVVVGDSRQLPPTAFFSTTATDDDDPEEETVGEIESILNLFLSKGARAAMLRWHYRSRHQSLIAVSNQEFYENKLKIFPSPDAAKDDVGLVYRYLPDTSYERGRGRAYNRGEARVVAAAVMEHAANRPDLSLGVAAFSQSQAQIILDELELNRRQDPSCEGFFSAHPEEPFFVKNLENVQGDERDIILISIGYGKDKDGYLAMNFGPLNQSGGERRLNVLITRARHRCEVFTNLQSEDIDLARSSAQGVRSLKNYLRFAQHEILDDQSSTSDGPDSPFEEEVATAIRNQGYTVDHQIGSGGFFVDLAVVDPTQPGRYLLGIECDGASYHSARWARDRDRIRQNVLEGLGWTIHRIWSTDWFTQPAEQLRRVLEAIAMAKEATPEVSQTPTSAGSFAVQRAVGGEPDSSPRASQLAPYEISTFSTWEDPLEAPPETIAQWIVQVVETESPVHTEEALVRVTRGTGAQRMGSKIRRSLEKGLGTAVRSGAIQLDSAGFLWRAGDKSITPRDRSDLPQSSRKLEFVCPEELEIVISNVVSGAHGISRGDIPSAVCQRFGFGRAGKKIVEIIDSCVAEMTQAETLIDRAGVLSLADGTASTRVSSVPQPTETEAPMPAAAIDSAVEQLMRRPGITFGEAVSDTTGGASLVDGQQTWEQAERYKHDIQKMMECCEAEIQMSRKTGLVPAPYYFERVAILARKEKDYATEVRYCEMYIDFIKAFEANRAGGDPPGIAASPRYLAIRERLPKAKSLLESSQPDTGTAHPDY